MDILFDHFGNIDAMSLLNTSDTAVTANDMTEKSSSVIALSRKYAFVDNVQTYSNLVVFGSDYILDSSLTSMPYYNNGDYFISIINKISGKENGIYIVAKDLSSPTYETNAQQANVLRIIFMFVLPALVAAAGIAVWLKRRHK